MCKELIFLAATKNQPRLSWPNRNTLRSVLPDANPLIHVNHTYSNTYRLQQKIKKPIFPFSAWRGWFTCNKPTQRRSMVTWQQTPRSPDNKHLGQGVWPSKPIGDHRDRSSFVFFFNGMTQSKISVSVAFISFQFFFFFTTNNVIFFFPHFDWFELISPHQRPWLMGAYLL